MVFDTCQSEKSVETKYYKNLCQYMNSEKEMQTLKSKLHINGITQALLGVPSIFKDILNLSNKEVINMSMTSEGIMCVEPLTASSLIVEETN